MDAGAGEHRGAPSLYSDKVLTCADCSQDFVFTASEQDFYATRSFTEPRRCSSCRASRKAARGDAGGGTGFTIDTSSAPWFNSNPTYTYKDNVTKIIGKHNLQFGGYFVAAQKNEDASVEPQGWLVFTGQGDESYSGTVGYNSTGNAFADLLLGQINQFGQASQKIKTIRRFISLSIHS